MHLHSLSAPRHRGPAGTAFGFAFVLASSLLSPALARAQDSATARAPGAGAYTEEQAERGNGVFTRACVECHTRKDMSGADFRLKWNGRTVFDLFDQIRTTMPDATPGSMTPAEYADVTAYFLKLNGMPAGSMPLPPDSTLRAVKLDIPASPSGQLVTRSVSRSVSRSVPRSVPGRDARALPHSPSRARAVHSLPTRRGP